jgi:hypothetical protein
LPFGGFVLNSIVVTYIMNQHMQTWLCCILQELKINLTQDWTTFLSHQLNAPFDEMLVELDHRIW